MSGDEKRCPSVGAKGNTRPQRSIGPAAMALALLIAAAPAKADDSQVIEQMKQQIRDLQKKLDEVIAAQKKSDEQLQKVAAPPPKNTANVVNGSDKVKLSISGQVDRGLMLFDDSHQTNLFNVDNGISSTRLRFIGEANPTDDLKVNANLEFDFRSNASDRIDQTQKNTGVDGDTLFRIRRASVSVTSKTFGKVTLGQDATATDGVAEYDLSGTYITQESDIQKLGGAMFFSPSDNFGTRRMNQIFNNFDDGRDDEVRYDSPTFYGFNLQADVAQGNGNTSLQDTSGRYAVAMHYKDTIEGTQIEAGVGYENREVINPDTPTGTAVFTDYDYQIAGSASVLFPFGLSGTFSAGTRHMQVTSNGRDDPFTYYGKIGYLTPDPWFSFGKTAFGVEWGEDFDLTANGDHGKMFGVAIVQNIDKWGMELFAAYRHFIVDEGANAAFAAQDVGDANLFFTGTRVKF